MSGRRVLVLTDQKSHNSTNSVYELCNAMQRDSRLSDIYIASRSQSENSAFFHDFSSKEVWARPLEQEIDFKWGLTAFNTDECQKVQVETFDLIWLRLPRPIPSGFFEFLENAFKDQIILNRPKGIDYSGSKAFLLEVADLCPPVKLCQNLEDIISFQRQFPIVLKPLEDYGGRGILRVENGQVLLNDGPVALETYKSELQVQFDQGGYLGMKFLEGVKLGDKRVVVVNGQVIGGLLRLPPKDSWLCNVSQGGRAVVTEVDADEEYMAARLNEKLKPLGIAIFGMDTLMGDDGKRILSEVNTLSIGGISSLGEMTHIPAADLVVKYFIDFAESFKK